MYGNRHAGTDRHGRARIKTDMRIQTDMETDRQSISISLWFNGADMLD